MLLPLLVGLFLQQPLGPPLEVVPTTPEPPEVPASIHWWSPADGLPQAQVNALASDSLGRIWMGTHAGLAIFDGTEIRPLTDAASLASQRVRSLCLDDRQRMWIGTERRGLAIFDHYDDPRSLRWIPVAEELGSNFHDLTHIRQARDGSLWVTHADGVVQLSPDGSLMTHFAGLGPIEGTAEEADGTVWFAGAHGLFRVVGDEVESLYDETLACLWVTEDGEILAADHHARVLHRRLDGGLTRYHFPEVGGGIRAIAEAPDGTIWFGGWNPVAWKDGTFLASLREEDARPPTPLDHHALLIDREGTLWIGAGGLASVVPRPVWVTRTEVFNGDTPRIALEDPQHAGQVWVGTYSGKLHLLAGDQVDAHETAEATALAASALDGRVYGASASRGLIRLDATHLNHFESLLPAEAVGPGPVLALAQDAMGAWWLGTGHELLAFDPAGDGSPRRIELPEDLGQIHKIEIAKDGRLWLGAERGVALLDSQGQLQRRWQSGEQLLSGPVREILLRPDGLVWAGHYGGGVSVFHAAEDSTRERLTRGRGLYENYIHRIVPIDDGGLALLGNRGLSVIDGTQVAAIESGADQMVQARVFDNCPGLAAFEGMGGATPAGGMMQNGDLVFPALQGVVRFRPSLAREQLPAPALLLSNLMASGESLDERVASDRSLLFRPGERTFAASFRAVTFVDPHLVRYQYQLIGADDDWVEAGGRQVAHYSSLAPGEYRFRVRGANRDGVWSESVESAPLRYQAALTERAGFWLLLIAASTLVITYVIRARFRRDREQQVVLEQTVATRTSDLAQARDRLETEVSVRTADLQRALEQQRAEMEQREQLQEQLRRTERLESVGRLSAGIAHDFNNILTSILGEADLGRSASQNQALAGRFDRIRQAGEHAAELTEQVLAFGRAQQADPRELEFDATVRQALESLASLLPPMIELDVELNAPHAWVFADPAQLQHIVTNLVLNARDAIAGPGRIQVQTITDDTDAQLVITDTGHGIDPKVLPHIFEPYFSTKQAGRGTGLGLASVHGVVEQLGGSIQAQSKPQQGARFTVVLPRTAPTEAGQDAHSTQEEPQATVMLCDDESSVLHVMRQALDGCGYRVLVAHGPDHARRVAHQFDGRIDLLVTDQIMPGTSGTELAASLQAERPELRVAHVSGYSQDGLAGNGGPSDADHFLKKPFLPEQFRGFVARALTT